MTDCQIAFMTVPTEADAERIAYQLVEQKLAACVNIVPSVRSIYRWQGKTCDDGELLLILKTVASKGMALTEFVTQVHPYSVPEIIFLPIQDGYPPYLKWLADMTAEGT